MQQSIHFQCLLLTAILFRMHIYQYLSSHPQLVRISLSVHPLPVPHNTPHYPHPVPDIPRVHVPSFRQIFPNLLPDQPLRKSAESLLHFNPLPHTEGDTAAMPALLAVTHFNPLPHTEGDSSTTGAWNY